MDDFLFDLDAVAPQTPPDSDDDTGVEDLVYPELEGATWKEMFALASAVRKREPWKDYGDSDWFGLVDPEGGGTSVVSILGNAGELFAIHVYQPDEGIRFWNLLLETDTADQGMAMFDMRMLECEFVNKAQLDKCDRDGFAAHDLQPAGRKSNNWPKFRATEPEHAPWPVNDRSAKLLGDALLLVPVFDALMARRFGDFYEKTDARGMPSIPIFDLKEGGDRRSASDWLECDGFFPVAPAQGLPEVPADDVFRARLSGLKVRRGTEWECGSFFIPEPIPVRGRLAFPTLTMTLEAGSDFFSPPQIGSPDKKRWNLLRQSFAAFAEQAGHLPERLLVASPIAELAFTDLAAATDLRLEPVENLPTLQPMIGSLAQMLRGGPPPGGGTPFPMDDETPIPTAAAGVPDYREPRSETRYQLRIDLCHAKPPIWRRITIPSDASFFDLHVAIQDAMGWEDAHLHSFMIQRGRDVEIEIVWSPEADDSFGPAREMLPEVSTTIEQLVGRGIDTFRYIYDWGDHWEHKVKVEKTLANQQANPLPKLITGRGACPPEDCGGLGGYYAIIEGDKEYTAHLDPAFVKWVQEDTFDPSDVEFEPAGELLAEHAFRNSF